MEIRTKPCPFEANGVLPALSKERRLFVIRSPCSSDGFVSHSGRGISATRKTS